MKRRHFLFSALSATLAGVSHGARAADVSKLKFGHRQANMVNEPGPSVFDLAHQIPELSGVELQVHFKGTTLWDQETLLGYKRAAERTGLKIPSIAGVWPPGATLLQSSAEENLLKAIRAAEALKASTILVATFEGNCPKMDQEQSYAPVVALLQKVASAAQDAGVTLGMETSLTPADDRKLVDMVNRPNLRVYYDLDNVERFGHTGQAVPGIDVLGKVRIRQVHLKNEDRLLDQPGRVNWTAAVQGLARIGYDGWFVFESSHTGPQQCIEATRKNIEFIRGHFA
jgi:sugar phosphate isomerase/epimerase